MLESLSSQTILHKLFLSRDPALIHLFIHLTNFLRTFLISGSAVGIGNTALNYLEISKLYVEGQKINISGFVRHGEKSRI